MSERPIQSLQSKFMLLTTIMNGLGSLMIIGVTILICSDIIGRSIFGTPVAGVAEIVSLSIVAIVFLQLGHAIQSNALARTDIFLSVIIEKLPKTGALLNAVFYLVAALLFAALVYGSWAKMIDAWVSNEHVGVYGLFVAPVWPVRVVVVLGSAVGAIQFASMTCREIAKVFKDPSNLEANTE